MSVRSSDVNEDQLVLRDLIGYAIPVIGAVVCFFIADYMKDKNEDVYDIFRDLAIAFFVALIVTVVYELYARNHYERKNFLNTLEKIMNEVVHRGVWKEVRCQIIEKSMIRERVDIELSLSSDGLPNGQMVLCMDFEYNLCGLRSVAEPVKVKHYLDDHIKCDEKDYPRFEHVEIEGERSYDRARLKKEVVNGVFSFDVTLRPRNKNPLRISTRRKEITYVPGSYNLIMGEMTNGISFKVTDLPKDIVAHVHLWPHTQKPIPLEVGKTLTDYDDKILLPGQACEFRFSHIDTRASKPGNQ